MHEAIENMRDALSRRGKWEHRLDDMENYMKQIKGSHVPYESDDKHALYEAQAELWYQLNYGRLKRSKQNTKDKAENSLQGIRFFLDIIDERDGNRLREELYVDCMSGISSDRYEKLTNYLDNHELNTDGFCQLYTIRRKWKRDALNNPASERIRGNLEISIRKYYSRYKSSLMRDNVVSWARRELDDKGCETLPLEPPPGFISSEKENEALLDAESILDNVVAGFEPRRRPVWEYFSDQWQVVKNYYDRLIHRKKYEKLSKR